MSNQTPYAWAVTGVQKMYLGEFAEHDAKLEAACCGGTARAFPLYAAPIQQMPLTCEQIAAAVRHLYADDISAEMGLDDDERTARAIEQEHGIKP